MSFDLRRMLDEQKATALADAQRYKDHDQDLCMLCHAYGADKRSLWLACFYDVKEAVAEFLDLSAVEDPALAKRGYYMRICKFCRGSLLGALREWADKARERRTIIKDHDGHGEWTDPDCNIPVRVDGAIVMMNAEQYKAREHARHTP